jgi:pyridoxamine 5'-phosphate oxidase
MAGIEDRDPFEVFGDWFDQARNADLPEPTAMALATADETGAPSLRMVLLKEHGPMGFVFFTNYESRKGRELLANPRAALCFHWKPLGRQVRVQGRVEQVSKAEADAYYASRARDSRIGAWASQQSRPMATRYDLEKNVAKFAAKYALGEIPRPPHWSGFRVVPHLIEFWTEKPFRLHERIVFERAGGDGAWTTSRLFP